MVKPQVTLWLFKCNFMITALDKKTALIIIDLQNSTVASPVAHPVEDILKNVNLSDIEDDDGEVRPKEEIEKIMNSEYIENTYKLLFIFFKSIYCLISKPVISITPDKVNIQLFYYLKIPKKKNNKTICNSLF